MQKSGWVIMNSRTHAAAWAEFTRVVKNRTKWPVKLMPEIKSNKRGCFEIWMGCLKNIPKTMKLAHRKMMKRETKNKSVFEFKKFRDILPMYGGDVKKTQSVVAKLHFIPDENLPDDKEERLYIIRSNVSFEKIDSTLENFEAKGEGQIDEKMADALLGEGGAFGDFLSGHSGNG